MTNQTNSQASSELAKLPRVDDQPVRDFLHSIVDAVDVMRRAVGNSDGEVQVPDDVSSAWDYLVSRMDSLSDLIDFTGREQAGHQIVRLLGYSVENPPPAPRTISVAPATSETTITLEPGAIPPISEPANRMIEARRSHIAHASFHLAIAGLSAQGSQDAPQGCASDLKRARDAIDNALKAEAVVLAVTPAVAPKPTRQAYQRHAH